MRVTLSIIILCVVVFILQILVPGFTEFFSLTPVLALRGAWWQFLTYMFLHDPFFMMHIFLNMFVLVIFGPIVEKALGWEKFLGLFLVSGLGSAVFHILLTGESAILMLGASGAVFGILTAYGFLFPKRWIIMFPGIPMPAFFAVFVFAGLELFFGVFGLEEGIANFGHLGGIVTGIAFMLAYKWNARRRKKMHFGEFEWVWE